MKIKRRLTALAITSAMCLGAIVGCSPAADQAAVGTGSGEAASSGSDYESLEVVNVADYREIPAVEDYIPTDCNISGTKEDGTAWKLAWLNPDSSDESMAYMNKCMKQVCEEAGCELISYDAQSDSQKQVDHINNAINQGVDAIIINPVDNTSTISALKKAKEQGILVVAAQNILDDEDAQDYYVGPDDTLAGRLAASMLIEALPDGGKVCCVEGMPGSTAQINRTKGFMGVMQNYDQFEVIDRQGCNNWSTAEAMNIMESDLSKETDIAAVYGHFDLATLTCIQAAQNVGRDGDIIFVSVDGTDSALAKIAEDGSCFYGTAFQDFMQMSVIQTDVALAALNGDGDELDKIIMPNYVAVTSENASELTAGWG